MRKAILPGLALGLVLAATGCGDSIGSAAREEIKQLDRKASVLEGITDRTSAEKARPELENINQNIKDSEERLKRLTKDKKPEKVLEALLAQQEAEEKARTRLREARARAIRNKDVAAALKGINLD